MKIYHYKHKTQAQKKQNSMKRSYGYTPKILKVKTPHKRLVRYLVVKPVGLRRLR